MLVRRYFGVSRLAVVRRRLARAAAATTVADNVAAADTWQKSMAYQLSCELKEENRRYSAYKVKKLDEVRITSYVQSIVLHL